MRIQLLGADTFLSWLKGLADVVLGAISVVIGFPDIKNGGTAIQIAATVSVARIPCQITHASAKGILLDSHVHADLFLVDLGGVEGDGPSWESTG